MARIDNGRGPNIAGSLTRLAAGWLPILALLAAWETFSRSGAVTPFMLPSLSSVLQRIAGDAISGELMINVGLTLYRALVGFLLAAVGGVVLGLLIARSSLFRWFFDPLISVAFPIPKIAFLPIFILWFGFFDLSKIWMVVFNTIFPVVTATIVAIEGVEREILWSARSLGTGERRLLWQIMLPAGLPQILTGLQVALPIALIVEIVTEMSMGGYGIGGSMLQASRLADSRGVFAGIIVTAAVGYAMVKAMALVRHRLLIWHQETAEPATA
jgi:ABC-type nitrate/sulfonate/bicarbonate transport system permease component